MSVPRNAPGVVALGGKIYAVGGFDGATVLKSGEVFDPAANSWRAIVNMSVARWLLGAAALGGKLYALSGEVFSPLADSWSTIANMTTGRSSPGAAALNGKIYVAGGDAGDASDALVGAEAFTPP